MSPSVEFATVPPPLIDQLIETGRKLADSNLNQRSFTGYETFRDAVVKSNLRDAIERIWLRRPDRDESRPRIDHCIDFEHSEYNRSIAVKTRHDPREGAA
jgi:hypothetical protein